MYVYIVETGFTEYSARTQARATTEGRSAEGRRGVARARTSRRPCVTVLERIQIEKKQNTKQQNHTGDSNLRYRGIYVDKTQSVLCRHKCRK
eukprot:2672256-Pleurochrysis_carterae.AAC.1